MVVRVVLYIPIIIFDGWKERFVLGRMVSMHPEARHFLDFVHQNLPQYYQNTKVLDVGGGDVNGNNRHYFKDCEYHANDVYAAPNVTVVCKTSALTFEDETFDMIISSECFEHDMEYEASLQAIVRMLKPGGLFVFTCASTGRPEHGTLRTQPEDSYTTRQNDVEWGNYYKNLTADDVMKAIPCQEVFATYNFYQNSHSHDLYFVGIKKNQDVVPAFPKYQRDFVKECL